SSDNKRVRLSFIGLLLFWQCLFLLCNERPLWHFPPKAVSFITVEGFLGDESFSLYAISGTGHKFLVPFLFEFASSSLVFAKLAGGLVGTPTEPEENDDNRGLIILILNP
ncbi:hypothetical protein AVEN_117104-1, partial [Araneus ventricosus]